MSLGPSPRLLRLSAGAGHPVLTTFTDLAGVPHVLGFICPSAWFAEKPVEPWSRSGTLRRPLCGDPRGPPAWGRGAWAISRGESEAWVWGQDCSLWVLSVCGAGPCLVQGGCAISQRASAPPRSPCQPGCLSNQPCLPLGVSGLRFLFLRAPPPWQCFSLSLDSCSFICSTCFSQGPALCP